MNARRRAERARGTGQAEMVCKVKWVIPAPWSLWVLLFGQLPALLLNQPPAESFQRPETSDISQASDSFFSDANLYHGFSITVISSHHRATSFAVYLSSIRYTCLALGFCHCSAQQSPTPAMTPLNQNGIQPRLHDSCKQTCVPYMHTTDLCACTVHMSSGLAAGRMYGTYVIRNGCWTRCWIWGTMITEDNLTCSHWLQEIRPMRQQL